jgi:hypothetical protein
MTKRRIIIRTLISILYVILLSSCGKPGVYINRNNGKVWIVDDSGGIQTNDLSRLQQAVPYKVVIPAYLPAEVSSAPVMFIKTIGMNSNSDVDVHFSYSNSPKSVTIDEVNNPFNWVPNTENGDSYIQINGIKVLQMPSINFIGNVTVNVYSYAWQANGVSFTLDVWDYNQDESKKVAESMIK